MTGAEARRLAYGAARTLPDSPFDGAWNETATDFRTPVLPVRLATG